MRRLAAILLLGASACAALFASGLTPSYASADQTLASSARGVATRLISGSDRYETSILLSKEAHPNGSPVVVIARGDDYSDALCAAPLAHALEGSLLLTRPAGLTTNTIAELQRLKPSRAYLVGVGSPRSAVWEQVARIVGADRVVSLVGANRFETAILVATELRERKGSLEKVVIAPSDSFPDALAAAPLASEKNWPILYTPQYGGLDAATRQAITDLGVSSVLEVGTRAGVDLADVVRLVGSDRYETCAMIAEYGLTQGLSPTHIAFAEGEDFPDGIASGPYLAQNAGILLLTHKGVPTAGIAELLQRIGGSIERIDAIGLDRVPPGNWKVGWVSTPSTSTTLPPSTTTTTANMSPATTTTTGFRPPTSTTTTTPAAPVTTVRQTTTTTAPAAPVTTVGPTTTTTTPAAPVTTVGPTTTTVAMPASGLLSVLDYGAKGDGVSDDIAAIQRAVTAAATADKGVYFPEGTYRISSSIWLPTGDTNYNNMTISGAGMGKTVIVMEAQSSVVYMFTAANLSGVALTDLTFRCPTGYRNNVRGVFATGMQNSSLQRIRVENCDYGFKLGSGNQASGWVCDDLQTSNVGILSMFVAYVSNSSFRNLSFQNRVDTGEGMCLYIERENHNLTFENTSCIGGSRNSMQFSNDYGTNPSDHITMRNTYLDNSIGTRYPFTVAATSEGMFSDIYMENTTLKGNSSENPCIVWYIGQRVVLDGVTASGGSALQAKYGSFSQPTSCEIRNGTYSGQSLGSVSGVTLTNVVAR